MWKLVALALMIVSCKSAAEETGLQCVDQTGAPLNGGIHNSQIGGVCGGGTGTVAAGQPCTSATECAPACCACPGDAGATVSVGYCMHSEGGSVCASEMATCCVFDLDQSKPGASPVCPAVK